MKSNTIQENTRRVNFGCDGSLEIFGVNFNGKDIGSVIFLAKGSSDVYRIFHSLPEFCSKSIVGWADEKSDIMVLVFEYSFSGELRDPMKLLKSVRHKLMRAIEDDIQEMDEYNWDIESRGC